MYEKDFNSNRIISDINHIMFKEDQESFRF